MIDDKGNNGRMHKDNLLAVVRSEISMTKKITTEHKHVSNTRGGKHAARLNIRLHVRAVSVSPDRRPSVPGRGPSRFFFDLPAEDLEAPVSSALRASAGSRQRGRP